MKILLLTLIDPIAAFNRLKTIDGEQLHRWSIIVFVCYGLISLNIPYESSAPVMSAIFVLLNVAITLIISLLLPMILSFIIYKVAQKQGGKATDMQMEATVAASYLPLIIGSALVLIFRYLLCVEANWNNPYFKNTILFCSLIYSFTILIIGIKRLNQFDWKKSVISFSPVIIMYVLYVMLVALR